jgi:hypothetical protein
LEEGYAGGSEPKWDRDIKNKCSLSAGSYYTLYFAEELSKRILGKRKSLRI